jgi:polyhydroxybutyrate depolymerase
MRVWLAFNVMLAGLAAVCSCSSHSDSGYRFTTGSAAGASSAGGPSASAGVSNAGGSMDNPEIINVVSTPGCGQDPGQALGMAVRGTIQTMGSKPADAADSKKGDWSYEREYFVTLPLGYDNSKAYPLVFEGPGCGGTGLNVLPLIDPTAAGNSANVGNTVIRVGLTPPPNDIGHSTLLNQGCFDDHEGDDSVDWVFYENLYDKLEAQLCFDENRVFASGSSSGAVFANELGCKYAGDATRPIRGIMSDRGGLPADARYEPTCTAQPMAGLWVTHSSSDPDQPLAETKFAIARAMHVNGCAVGTGYDNAPLEAFPIGGGQPDTVCEKISGCLERYPLVLCPSLPGDSQSNDDNVTEPGFSKFIKLFSTAPLLGQ